MDRGLANIQAWFLGVRHLSDLLYKEKTPGEREEVVSPSPMLKNGDKSHLSLGFGFLQNLALCHLFFFHCLNRML